MSLKCLFMVGCFLLLLPLAGYAHDEHPVAVPDTSAKTGLLDYAAAEKIARLFSKGGFSLYRQNYVMFSRSKDQTSGSDTEIKFQLSFKQEFGDSGVYGAYTQKSFWRVFDGADSRPFRETNYSPELFWRIPSSWLWTDAVTIDLGLFQHESNGMTEPTSRSWDRSYIRGAWDFGRIDAELKVWHRWSEDVKRYEDDPQGDENPDITDYYGYGELRLGVDLFWESYLRVMARHNFETSKGAVQVDYSLPIASSKVALYLQFWDGYGESLIDYDQSLTKYGIGLRFFGKKD